MPAMRSGRVDRAGTLADPKALLDPAQIEQPLVNLHRATCSSACAACARRRSEVEQCFAIVKAASAGPRVQRHASARMASTLASAHGTPAFEPHLPP